jgi:asparagine synthase (glutamine-hydrolysing)
MCAIVGIKLRKPGSLVHPEKLIEEMSSSMTHRGPDDAGIFCEAAKGVFLGHRRLSIIDLSPAGQQPFYNEDKTVAVLVNGEIYNYRELRKELLSRGHKFRSDCDVEVIPHLFEEKGVDCVKQLRGMYAAAVYDFKKGTLWLVRDPLGIKPLYFFENSELFAFSSEVQALQKLSSFKTEWDHDGLIDFLMWGSIPSPRTHFKQVRALLPGEVIQVDDSVKSHGGNPVQHWCREALYGPVPELIDMKECLRDSVSRHMISDAPIGIFLSGGIDSGTIAGLATETLHSKVHTISISIPGHELDESRYARQTAQYYGTQHTELNLDQKSLENDIDRFFKHIDLPSIDGLNTYIVSKTAHQAGLKVSLSGVGGDELFAGYSNFEKAPFFTRWHSLASMGGPLGRELAATTLKWLRPNSSAHRIAEIFRSVPVDIRSGYFACRGMFAGRLLEDLLIPDLKVKVRLAHQRYMDETEWVVRDNYPAHLAIAGLEFTRYLTSQLLRDTDTTSMAHSLEVRTPLVDVEVLRCALPFLNKLPRGDGHPKWLLRQALSRPLPNEVTQRVKQGFVFPWQEWLRGFVLKDFDRRIQEDLGCEFFNKPRLQWWRDRYVDGWAHWSNFWAIYVLLRFFQSSSRK